MKEKMKRSVKDSNLKGDEARSATLRHSMYTHSTQL